jgi:hypothetical protein
VYHEQLLLLLLETAGAGRGDGAFDQVIARAVVAAAVHNLGISLQCSDVFLARRQVAAHLDRGRVGR